MKLIEELLRKSEEMVLPSFDQAFVDKIAELELIQKTFWNIPREVGELLFKLVSLLDAKKILEVGTSNGYSGLWLSMGLKCLSPDHVRKLVTIESHEGRYVLAKENFLQAKMDEYIFQVKGHAPEAFFDNEIISNGDFDLLFFDATKKQHTEFLEKGFALLNQGGLLMADNVLSHWDAMKPFVEAVENTPLLEGKVLQIGQGVYVGIKK